MNHNNVLFTINPTWTALGLNAGLCGKKLASNDLNYGTPLTHTHTTILNNKGGDW